MTHCDVVVLGAGASGLVCAAQCARRGRRVVIVDHADRPGLKVRISGGGRCNVTNRRVRAEDYVCANPHFVKSALAQDPPKRFLAFLAAHGVETVEADHGRLFCVPGAAAVVAALLREAEEAGVFFALGESICEVSASDNGFQVHCRTRSFASRSLVVATGGPAWPRIGSTDFGSRLAEQFGLRVFPARPGLVPLLASKDLLGFCRDLSGISLPVRVVVEGARIPDGIEDALLFTHRGISGPATLDASLYWRPGRHLGIDLLPGRNINEMLAQAPRREVRNALAVALPTRLAELLCHRHGWSGQAGNLPKKQCLVLERTIHAFPFHPSGTEGFDKAEVTLGGVDTDGVSSKTMEAKAVSGLYFTGEVLDVTGRLGGYNLQWAWSSGFVAGQWA
jgi:predicted Rossmann fold flavoprotein